MFIPGIQLPVGCRGFLADSARIGQTGCSQCHIANIQCGFDLPGQLIRNRLQSLLRPSIAGGQFQRCPEFGIGMVLSGPGQATFIQGLVASGQQALNNLLGRVDTAAYLAINRLRLIAAWGVMLIESRYRFQSRAGVCIARIAVQYPVE